MVQFHIGFDESHKERGKLSTNYQTLRKVLESDGFGVWEYSSFPITRESLQNYDILVFACTDSSKFSPDEIAEIGKWVREDGGGVLLLSHAGGDRGRRTNMSELATQFGMLFESDQVLDQANNFGIENMPNIKIFPTPHPIIEGIGSICYRAGSSISIVGMAETIAMADNTSDPTNATVIAASEHGKGKAVGIGSYEIFRDEISGGIEHQNHKNLVKGIFEWLITQKRRELRSGGVSASPTDNQGNGGGSFDPYGVMEVNDELNGDYSEKLVNITSVHDLFLEIQNIMKDLDLLRARVQNVYNVAAMLDNTSEETQSGKVAGPNVSEPEPEKDLIEEPIEEEGPPSQDELLALIKGKTDKKKEAPSKSSRPSMGSLLSELKDEQDKRESGEKPNMDDLLVKQPGLGKVADDLEIHVDEKTSKKQYELTASDKRKSKAELEDGVDKLQAKLKSVDNLKGFIERKFKDGKIDEEEYNKESKKFQDDLDYTTSKIEAYKQLMDSK